MFPAWSEQQYYTAKSWKITLRLVPKPRKSSYRVWKNETSNNNKQQYKNKMTKIIKALSSC